VSINSGSRANAVIDAELEAKKQPKKAALAGMIGSALEYYDFFIYASATAIVFNKIFFDQSDPAMATVLSFATFGVGYVARPIGALVLGHWGDKYGRKPVLIFTLFLMGAATVLIGCLPTYSQIGIWAPALLVFLRLVQGFSAGGEQSGANSMSLEHAPNNHRAFVTSWTLWGTQFGQILAAAVFIPLAAMGDQVGGPFLSWGWRIPFIASFVVIIVGYIIRRTLEETPVFEAEAQEGKAPATPLATMFKHHTGDVLRVLVLACVNTVPTIFGVWILAYATGPRGISSSLGLGITATVNTVALLFIPLWARLSDRIGRRPVFITSALGCGAMMWVYLTTIDSGNIAMIYVVAALMQGVVYSGLNSVWPSFYGEMFPTKVRLSGMALGTQIGFALGGFAPTIAAGLAGNGKNGWMPVYLMVLGVTVVVAIVAYFTPETAHKSLREIDAEEEAKYGVNA
jgi:MFS family permease